MAAAAPGAAAPPLRVPLLVPAPPYALDRPEEPVAFEVAAPLRSRPVPPSRLRPVMDASLFVLLLVAGSYCIYLAYHRAPDAQDDLGPVLFNAGLTPVIFSAWAICTGLGVKNRENAIKGFTGALSLLLGLYLRRAENLRDVVMVLGPALFEIGALFFISKMFFLGEDDEKTIADLQKELQEARASAGTGMALSYFYNFVLPTCMHLPHPDHEKPATLDVEVAPRQPTAPVQLTHPELLIFIPRTLEKGADLKAAIRRATEERALYPAKPQQQEGVPGFHRLMFAFCLRVHQSDGGTGQGVPNVAAGLCDVPTIISAALDRAADPYEKLKVDPARDIRDFQNRLVELISQNPHTHGKARIISLPPFPFDIRVLAAFAGSRDSQNSQLPPLQGSYTSASTSSVASLQNTLSEVRPRGRAVGRTQPAEEDDSSLARSARSPRR